MGCKDHSLRADARRRETPLRTWSWQAGGFRIVSETNGIRMIGTPIEWLIKLLGPSGASRSRNGFRTWSWQPGALPGCQRNKRNPYEGSSSGPARRRAGPVRSGGDGLGRAASVRSCAVTDRYVPGPWTWARYRVAGPAPLPVQCGGRSTPRIGGWSCSRPSFHPWGGCGRCPLPLTGMPLADDHTCKPVIR